MPVNYQITALRVHQPVWATTEYCGRRRGSILALNPPLEALVEFPWGRGDHREFITLDKIEPRNGR